MTAAERGQILTALIAQESLENAVGVYHTTQDRELAAMAAYKALGLDPRDVTKFGWGQLMGTKVPGEVHVTQQVSQPEPAKSASPWKAALLGAAAAGLLGAAGFGLWSVLQGDGQQQSAPGAAEFEIRWWVKDGKAGADWKQVEPGK